MSIGPLDGFTIGVTADRRWKEQAELLERRGARIMHGPSISTHYLGSDDNLRAATAEVIGQGPDYLVATTGIGVRAWFEAAQAWGLENDLVAALRPARAVARGPKAAAALKVAGLDTWQSVPSERVDEVIAVLTAQQLGDKLVAWQHYGEGNPTALDSLRRTGADVIEVPVYQWRLPDDDEPARRLVEAACAGVLDAVTFTSAPAVANLMRIAEAHGLDEDLKTTFNQRDVVAACVGPVCAQGAYAAGLDEPLTPATGRLGLLVRSLTEAMQSRRRELRYDGGSLVIQGCVALVGQSVVRLSPRESAVLAALVRRPGAVVSKSTLLSQVWPGGANDQHAVETAVGRL
ncbi:MAG TPA: uroporphyrinogen-III synthase, partial [Acidimicrobiales bacterium]|nr:uroporphyrinogen-III synthase [Acidimicrobiales bacterium]